MNCSRPLFLATFADGQPLWTANGLAICVATNTQSMPAITLLPEQNHVFALVSLPGNCADLRALVQWMKQLRLFGKLRLETMRRPVRVKGFKVLPKRWIVENLRLVL